MPHQVFISYASEDKPAADALLDALESRDIPCWIAPRDVLPSMRWGAAINQAIGDSMLMVLLLSTNSNRSDHIANEIQAATHARIAILPLRIEDVEPSSEIDLFIRGRHWLDGFAPSLEANLDRVAATVARILDRVCPSCKSHVSESAAACPTCGYDLSSKQAASSLATSAAADQATVDAVVATDAGPSDAASVVTDESSHGPRDPAGSTTGVRLPDRLPRAYWLAGGGAVVGVVLLAVLLLGGGGGDTPVTPPSTETAPVVRIFFAAPDAGGVEQVFSMTADGGDRIQVTSGSTPSIEPTVSSDGARVVFARGGDLYLLDLATGEETLLPAPAGSKSEPELSPDGTRVVFAMQSGDYETVYVMNLDGSDARALTGSDFDEQDPSWSPDGTRIAFSSNREPDNHDIYTIAADGAGNPTRITRAPGFDGEPAWSPDGSTIAFQSFRSTGISNNNFNIWTVAIGGSDEEAVQITFAIGSEFDPTWGPDGNQIAFSGELDGNFDVYVIDVSGGERRRLTNSPDREVRPSWCICPAATE